MVEVEPQRLDAGMLLKDRLVNIFGSSNTRMLDLLRARCGWQFKGQRLNGGLDRCTNLEEPRPEMGYFEAVMVVAGDGSRQASSQPPTTPGGVRRR